ncbi:hypothetical protein ACKC9G_18355 [Pokkaliibacter sp. CJK22405]|uniref:hypothetical protein n=1 Tax=Pokkaliibacter sp. CJK22405 TaxID=3384615 RepID=UPI0039851A89
MHIVELQELAGAALGLTEEQTDAIFEDDEDFDSPLIEKFGIDFDQFCNVVEALLPLTPTLQSPLTDAVYHAFVRQLGAGDCRAIVKMKAKEQPKKEEREQDGQDLGAALREDGDSR